MCIILFNVIYFNHFHAMDAVCHRERPFWKLGHWSLPLWWPQVLLGDLSGESIGRCLSAPTASLS